MKIVEIVNKLADHSISKQEAIEKLKEITEGMRKNGSLTFEVTNISYSVVENHAFLSIKMPYGYNDVKKSGIKSGDKVDVMLIP